MTRGCHFSNLRHVCSDSFHALRCPGVSGVEMKIYEKSEPAWQAFEREGKGSFGEKSFRRERNAKGRGLAP